MAFVLLSWLLLFVLVSAIGCSFVAHAQKFHRGGITHSFSIYDCFWIGLLSVIAIFQLWNFFSPLNSYSLIVFLVLPLLNAKAIHGMMRERFAVCLQFFSPGRFTFFLAASAAILLVCAQGVSTLHWSGAAYDTDLYHFNWIEWANEFPVIPGLANLHSRLGLNSGFLTFSALIDNLWWDKKTTWKIYRLVLMKIT